MIRPLLAAAAVAATGCATAPAWRQLNHEANQALSVQDYRRAREYYQRSLAEADRSGDRQYAAVAMYGLARANGYLCNVEEAEEWFKKSIAARESLPDSREAYLSQNHLELARLYVARQRWTEAVHHFGRGLSLLQGLDIETRDPIGYADVLADYAHALRSTGDRTEAATVEDRIRALRSTHPSRQAEFRAEPYPTNCAGG